MPNTRHIKEHGIAAVDALLTSATSDLIFALGGLRMLTILTICPDLVRDAEAHIGNALDLLSDARSALLEGGA